MSTSKQSKLDLRPLWKLGLYGLSYLRDDQLDLYDHINKHDKPVIECARRYGKTTSMLAFIEDALRQNPNWVCRWCSPLKEQSRTIVKPELEKFETTCPPSLKAVWHAIGSYYEFPNGSKLYLIGVNRGQAESARGPFAHIIVCDEYGFWDDPDIVETILQPQLLTTRGKLIIASTPPGDLGHTYYNKTQAAVRDGRFIQRTIYQNESLTDEDIDKAIVDSGGEASAVFQREYLCRPIADQNELVIPEFKEAIHVSEDKPGPLITYYVSLDLGFNDNTAALFGGFDFEQDKLFIFDEVLLNGANSKTIVEACKAKEAIHFDKAPHKRVSDNDIQQLYDFQTLYDYSVIATEKWDKIANINKLRIHFGNAKISIHPRCNNLIYQLKVGIWNKQRTDFKRGDKTGHLDAIDALIYLSRNVDRAYNPQVIEINHHTTFQNPYYVSDSKDETDLNQLADALNQNGF